MIMFLPWSHPQVFFLTGPSPGMELSYHDYIRLMVRDSQLGVQSKLCYPISRLSSHLCIHQHEESQGEKKKVGLIGIFADLCNESPCKFKLNGIRREYNGTTQMSHGYGEVWGAPGIQGTEH